MTTLLTDEQFGELPVWEPEAKTEDVQMVRGIIENLAKMLDDPSRWTRVEKIGLLFVHDTGVYMQLHRHPKDHFNGGKLSTHAAFWLEGMLPFRVGLQREPARFNMGAADIFLLNYSREETRETIERIGVLAALCRE